MLKHNYFYIIILTTQTKLFLHLYLVKFFDILAKLFFPHTFSILKFFIKNKNHKYVCAILIIVTY